MSILMRKRVLIFYISKYSGHYHAAKAIEEAFLNIHPRAEVEKINALDYTNPVLGRMINRAYLHVIKKRPQIWGRMYDNPEVLKKTKKAREVLHRFNMSKIMRLMEKKRPSVVICTQAFPCGMVADYKKAASSDLKLIGVLTDHAPHSYWLFDEVDYYVVPDGTTAEMMNNKGIPMEKIKVLGIPVSPKFKDHCERRKTLKDMGLSERCPTILIMGGSQGLGAIEAAVRSVSADTDHGYQLIVVTGKNKKLFSKLSGLAKTGPGKNIRVLSFVDNIDALMAASDVIITKAGGMTTAEALTKDLPMIIVDPIPGHERMNADYLIREGAAIEISDYTEIHSAVNRLFGSDTLLGDMRKRAKALSSPDSAENIAKLALAGI